MALPVSERNAETTKDPGIVAWLTSQRDFHATARKTLMDAIQRRDDQVKLGIVKADEVAKDNSRDLVQSHEHDTLSLRYYTALAEILQSRLRLDAMTKALRDRTHYQESVAPPAEAADIHR